MAEVKIEQSWRERLEQEFVQPYFLDLVEFVKSEYASKPIFPPGNQIFRAFELCPFERVKVVIIGQDPYHGSGQANGLSFAVGQGVSLPPSLQNIYKEIADDLGIAQPTDGDLSRWAKQGVLLLNATLTVRAKQPGSHQNKGWEQFTDAVIKKLNSERDHLVFLLWGTYAQRKGQIIDRQRHLVLSAAHPSPFSAHKGFFGCKHFSRANEYLLSQDGEAIDWE